MRTGHVPYPLHIRYARSWFSELVFISSLVRFAWRCRELNERLPDAIPWYALSTDRFQMAGLHDRWAVNVL